MKLNDIDNEREFDWGRTSDDYGAYRAGYPEDFYDLLASIGIGQSGQRILDLGTGTGVLARAFATRGAQVSGFDIAENQIAVARKLSEDDGLDIELGVKPAEDVDFPDNTFDVISAGQSWLYFDKSVMIPKVLRLLKVDGCLVLTHLLWLPLKDRVAGETESLVLKHNPDWQAAGYAGNLPSMFAWAKEDFDLKNFESMELPLEFTHETWRGRIRACRGVGASMDMEEVERFDRELKALLESSVSASFEVLHQMTAHVLVRKQI